MYIYVRVRTRAKFFSGHGAVGAASIEIKKVPEKKVYEDSGGEYEEEKTRLEIKVRLHMRILHADSLSLSISLSLYVFAMLFDFLILWLFKNRSTYSDYSVFRLKYAV
jgi:hypothetical protein